LYDLDRLAAGPKLSDGRLSMKRRRTFLLIFAILIGVLIVGLILLWRSRGGGSLSSLLGGEPADTTVTPQVEVKVEPTPERERERVVVALQTVPRGQTVPPDAVELRDWPKEDVSADTARRLENVVGRIARVDIPRQQPVSEEWVTDLDLGAGSEMALAIPKGKIAIAIPVKVLSAVANAIRPNDRVDVLISFSMVEIDQDSQIKLPIVLVGEDCLAGCQKTGTQIPRLVTQYSVQNAQVLSVGLWSEELPELEVPEPVPTPEVPDEEAPPAPEPPSVADAATQLTSVTLVVSPQDALVLKWALETNASMDLVMRSAVDQDTYAQPEAVTLQYMLDRFQMSVPPKLPHAPENEFRSNLISGAQGSPPGGE
jgi:pilus assembly protein CpaB